MTDEDSEGIPRRHLLGFIGSTGAAVAVSTWWNWDNIQTVLDNRDEPSRSRQDQNPNEGSDYDDSSGGADENQGADPNYPGHSDELYDNWEDAIPEGCELPSSYETAVEQKVDEYDELDGDDLTEYVNTGRVQFRRGESEIYMLVDADGDGQYDDKGHSIPDVC